MERGRSVDADALAQSAESFETAIFPTVQRLVGGGRDVGAVTLLHANVPGVAGYFNSSDMFPQWVHPESNQRPMLYLNFNAVRPGTPGYTHTVSHELAHMFHFYVDAHEYTWVKEGPRELAQELVDPLLPLRREHLLEPTQHAAHRLAALPAVAVDSYHYQAGELRVPSTSYSVTAAREFSPALLATAAAAPALSTAI